MRFKNFGKPIFSKLRYQTQRNQGSRPYETLTAVF